MSLRTDIALADTRINELARNIPDIGAVKQWTQLRKIADRLQAAIECEDTLGMRKHSRALIDAVSEGADQRRTWEDIQVTQEHKRKLSDSEWKRLIDMRQMVTVEQINSLIIRIGMAFNNVATLFVAKLGEDGLTQMKRMFGRELRDLQNVRDPADRPKRSTATYATIDVVPKPKTVGQARKEAAQLKNKGE